MKVIIKLITECAVKRADHTNGYFIQNENWGTCFFRMMNSEARCNEIDMTYNQLPSCFHMYTKFPARIADRVFHVYVNYPDDESVQLNLPPGGMVLSFDTPQRSGRYWNRSFLVLCPDGQPEVELTEYSQCEPDFYFFIKKSGELPIPWSLEQQFRGRTIQKMFLQSDSAYIQKRRHEHETV